MYNLLYMTLMYIRNEWIWIYESTITVCTDIMIIGYQWGYYSSITLIYLSFVKLAVLKNWFNCDSTGNLNLWHNNILYYDCDHNVDDTIIIGKFNHHNN